MKNKNLWLLPTDKASRLVIYENNDFILLNRYEPSWIETNFNRTNQHIYITSDKEIKGNVWVINIVDGSIYKTVSEIIFVDVNDTDFHKWRKIILTTDQDLIKDGIQAIDDEFLEWFVKNPSCELVDIGTSLLDGKDGYGYYGKYKIIIPSKEPINHPNILSNSLTNKVNKQEKSMKDTAEELAEIAIILTNNSANYQETLEEVAEKQCEVEGWGLYEGLSEQCAIKNSFKAGAIWQQEQDKKMYSEEDMKQAFHVGRLYLGREGDTNFEQFIEEFKNK